MTITCYPAIRWEDATFKLRMLRRCYFPLFVAWACAAIGWWWFLGAPLDGQPPGMTRWQITDTAWKCYMAMYEVGVKRRFITIDEAIRRLWDK